MGLTGDVLSYQHVAETKMVAGLSSFQRFSTSIRPDFVAIRAQEVAFLQFFLERLGSHILTSHQHSYGSLFNSALRNVVKLHHVVREFSSAINARLAFQLQVKESIS